MSKLGKQSLLILLLSVFVAIAACLIAERPSAGGKAEQELEMLHMLNRASIENMSIGEGPVYVIGHKSPDSDTVCSAIAYARLLSLLGYPAEPAVTMKINHESEYILKKAGVDVPPILEDASGLSIFLVDHSEYAQAVPGLEDAHIVGIFDHHGVGTVTTGHQVVYNAKPIGATATIVWLEYLNCGVEIDRSTAMLLLGAVLSDTKNLTGSTVTGADRQAVPALAKIAGVKDVEALFKDLHAASLSYEGMTDEEILYSDYKEYEASGVKFGIGLAAASDEETSVELAHRLKEAMQKSFPSEDVDLMYAAVSMREDGKKYEYVVPADEYSEEVLKAAFPDYDEYDGTSYLYYKGLGRKTVFVPGLTDFLAAYPHE